MAKKKVTPKKASNKKTYVAIVVDRSGSMSSIHKQTVDGINEQFGVLRRDGNLGGTTEVTLVQFDDQIDIVFDGLNSDELQNWDMADFQPRGYTAMYDGIMRAINVLKTKERTDDTAFLVCVISDGAENASKETSQVGLAFEIDALQKLGNWTFTYLLANNDIAQVSRNLNVPIANVAAFNSTGSYGAGAMAYTVNASNVSSYLSSRDAGLRSTITFYNDDQKNLLSTAK